MGSTHTKAAREYMAAHPGVTFPEAKRAVDRSQGGVPPATPPTPWVRRSVDRARPTACYFCGDSSAILSSGDLKIDSGRVQMYCDNGQCDAREVEFVVVDDGTEATRHRADVRILRKHGPIADRPAWTLIEEIGDWIPGATPAARDTTSRCLFCGEHACAPAPADVPGDTGRLRMRCSNPRCHVREVEVLVVRDGTPWTADRDDNHDLEQLVPRGPGTKVGTGTVYSIDDYRRFTDEDTLERRVSGPMP